MPAPLTCVGPVRSHMPPMITSFCCAVTVPEKHSAATAAAAISITVPDKRLIVFSPLLLRAALIREWPDPEVISDIAPQPVQPLRLHRQKENDQAAERDQPQIGNRVL